MGRRKPNECCMCMTGASAAISLVAVVVAVVATLKVPTYVNDQLESGIKDAVYPTNKDTAAYKSFQSNDHEGDPKVRMSYYLFNIKNMNEVLKGSKPELEEVGPFVYWEHKERIHVTFPTPELLQYKEWQYYTFIEEESKSLDTKVTTINMPLIGLLGGLKAQLKVPLMPEVIAAINEILDKAPEDHKMFMTRTAREIIHGFDAPVLLEMDKIIALLAKVGVSMPKIDPFFSIATNVTSAKKADETLMFSIVNNGLNDPSKIGQYKQWNGVTAQKWFNDYEEKVMGTDASWFNRDVTDDQTLYMFLDDAMRVVRFDHQKNLDTNGVHLKRFAMDPSCMSAGGLNEHHYGITVSGMMNVGHLADPADSIAVYLSKPHFLDTDPLTLNSVAGLKPDADLHDSLMDIEPITGKVFKATKKLQLSLHVNSDIPEFFRGSSEAYVPIFWADEHGGASDDQLEQFKSSIYLGQSVRDNTAKYGWWVVGGTGMVCLALFATLLVMVAARRKAEAEEAAATNDSLGSYQRLPNTAGPEI